MNEFFVSTAGDDMTGDGSAQRPFATVTRGARDLEPGDRLSLKTGIYYGNVVLDGLGEPNGDHIVIGPADGHRATIDGADPDFIEDPEHAWAPVEPVIAPPGVAPAGLGGPIVADPPGREYRSNKICDPGTDRGAFVSGRPSYTRLITYCRPEDFRAINQRFGKLPDAAGPPGPREKLPKKPTDIDKAYPRRPWVYMGPGLWQHDKGRVHVRLSHTTNDIPEVEDYRGETDPRKLSLAIWPGGDGAPPTLTIRDCKRLDLRELTIQHGVPSVLVTGSTEVALSHLAVNAGNYGIRVGEGCQDIRITDTVVDGGLPRWSFRSDRKDDYVIDDGTEEGTPNQLGAATSRALIASHIATRNLWIEHCEFVNGHDLQIAGSDVTFTRNWIRNLNDDAIYVGEVSVNMRIIGNVLEQCLMAISTESGSLGELFVHRNLIDLRLPTRGRRPHPDRSLVPDIPDFDLEVFRFGNMLKNDNEFNPALNLTHSTVLVVDQRIQSSYNLFRNTWGGTPRRAYNNIFLAINRHPDADLPIAFLPQPTDPAETNGNCYFRIGRDSAPMFRVRKPSTPTPGEPDESQTFDDLAAVTNPLNPYFVESMHEHPPGFEKDGLDKNPQLRRYWPPFELPGVEDLRLTKSSPARHRGISLAATPLAWLEQLETPDMGSYLAYDSPPLQVGVDGRRHFPSSGLVDPVPRVLG
jgi:hypothetical protein